MELFQEHRPVKKPGLRYWNAAVGPSRMLDGRWADLRAAACVVKIIWVEVKNEVEQINV